MKNTHSNIEPDKFYSAKAVTDMGILPCKSRKTFCKLLRTKKWANIFNVVEHKSTNSTRFYIKGIYIINYINLQNNGKLRTKKQNEI